MNSFEKGFLIMVAIIIIIVIGLFALETTAWKETSATITIKEKCVSEGESFNKILTTDNSLYYVDDHMFIHLNENKTYNVILSEDIYAIEPHPFIKISKIINEDNNSCNCNCY
jgi:uncharacterized protein YpmS